jgi:hypothetical protein
MPVALGARNGEGRGIVRGIVQGIVRGDCTDCAGISATYLAHKGLAQWIVQGFSRDCAEGRGQPQFGSLWAFRFQEPDASDVTRKLSERGAQAHA